MTNSVRLLTMLAVLTTAAPAVALAQITPRKGGSFLYGISFGAGQRTTSGATKPSHLPVTASPPPSPVTVGALDIEGGITLTGRFAIAGTFERRSTFGAAPGGWGTAGGHAVFRAWVVPRVWLEGGVGPSELAYRPPDNQQAPTTRWWTAGYEAGGGYEIFQGPTITLHVFARYTTATFDGLRVRTLTVQVGILGRAK